MPPKILGRPFVPKLRQSPSRAASLARQKRFSDGSVSHWDFLVALRGDIARQGHLLAERRAGRATLDSRPTILARLDLDKRRAGELLATLRGGVMPSDELTPIDPTQARALLRLVARLYDLAEIGVLEGAELVADAAEETRRAESRRRRAYGEGVAREAEIVRTLIASDAEVWPLLGTRERVAPAAAS